MNPLRCSFSDGRTTNILFSMKASINQNVLLGPLMLLFRSSYLLWAVIYTGCDFIANVGLIFLKKDLSVFIVKNSSFSIEHWTYRERIFPGTERIKRRENIPFYLSAPPCSSLRAPSLPPPSPHAHAHQKYSHASYYRYRYKVSWTEKVCQFLHDFVIPNWLIVLELKFIMKIEKVY